MLNLFDQLSKVSASYESKSVWAFQANLVPSLQLSDTCQLNADKYEGYRLKITTKDSAGATHLFYAEIHKDSRPAAKNNHANWKLDTYIAERAYNGVALTNGETKELAEYELEKDKLALVGVTIDTSRKDQGIITIPKFDPSIPIENQKAAVKMFAVAIV